MIRRGIECATYQPDVIECGVVYFRGVIQVGVAAGIQGVEEQHILVRRYERFHGIKGQAGYGDFLFGAERRVKLRKSICAKQRQQCGKEKYGLHGFLLLSGRSAVADLTLCGGFASVKINIIREMETL